MLCEILRDPGRVADPRYIAEPKLDGQRAQVHVEGGPPVLRRPRALRLVPCAACVYDRKDRRARHPAEGWAP
jgi:hypothetical protein